MDLFSQREKEIFESLKELRRLDFVVIGGYAVSAYVLPRFSVDCDIVVKDAPTADKVCTKLENLGYVRRQLPPSISYGDSFCRLEKVIQPNLKASFDILIGAVSDRRTGASFSAGWVFSNSKRRKLRGKTFPESIEARVSDVDALIALKLVAGRSNDLRDVFMLLPSSHNVDLVLASTAEKTDLKTALKRLALFASSPDFRKNLQGVYGFIDHQVFQKHVKAVEKLCQV